MNKMTKSHAAIVKNIGIQVQKRRKEKGYTQEELASILDITRVYMGYIEQGRAAASMNLLIKISQILQLNLQDLFAVKTKEEN